MIKKRYVFVLTILILFSSTSTVQAALPPSTSKTWNSPIRTFVLDTLGQKVNDTNPSPLDAELKEIVDGKVVHTWKVKYEKKGNTRAVCDPPVMNISFDKADKRGNQRELFTGQSTHPGRPFLQYQDVRFIALCDPTEYTGGGNYYGLKGKIDPHLREYSLFKIFRAFNVPTMDIIGYANVSFISPEAAYTGKTFRYLLVQRNNELDDELPFVSQFGFEPGLIEDGGKFRADREASNRFSVIHATGPDGRKIVAPIDPENILRISILAALVQDGDRGVLHNEDYAKKIGSDVWMTVPYSFDLSLAGCTVSAPLNHLNAIQAEINNLSPAEQKKYKAIYYRVARDIFSKPESLAQMLAIIDGFPAPANKELLKDYMRVTFYKFATIFASKEFADYAEAVHQPFMAPGFDSDTEYAAASKKFLSQCSTNPAQAPTPHIGVEVKSGVLESIPEPTEHHLKATYRINITAPLDQDLYIRKVYAFEAGLYKTDGKLIGTYRGSYEKPPGIPENPGPYYVIPKGKTAEFLVVVSAKKAQFEVGKYFFRLMPIMAQVGMTSWSVPPNQTNEVVVVGENSPFINSITIPTNLCNAYVIKGIRFNSKNNILTFSSKSGSRQYKKIPSVANGTHISFHPSSLGINAGSYSLTVTNPEMGEGTGLSNAENIHISYPRTPCPSPSPTASSISNAPQEGDIPLRRSTHFIITKLAAAFLSKAARHPAVALNTTPVASLNASTPISSPSVSIAPVPTLLPTPVPKQTLSSSTTYQAPFATTPTSTLTPTPSVIQTPTATLSPSSSVGSSVSPVPSPSVEPPATPFPSPSPSARAEASVTPTPSVSSSPSPSASIEASPIAQPTSIPFPSPSSSSSGMGE